MLSIVDIDSTILNISVHTFPGKTTHHQSAAETEPAVTNQTNIAVKQTLKITSQQDILVQPPKKWQTMLSQHGDGNTTAGDEQPETTSHATTCYHAFQAHHVKREKPNAQTETMSLENEEDARQPTIPDQFVKRGRVPTRTQAPETTHRLPKKCAAQNTATSTSTPPPAVPAVTVKTGTV